MSGPARAAGRSPPQGTLTFRQHGVGVELEVLEGAFASAGVDAGTKQLLRRLADDRFAGVPARSSTSAAATGRWRSGWRRPRPTGGARRRP